MTKKGDCEVIPARENHRQFDWLRFLVRQNEKKNQAN